MPPEVALPLQDPHFTAVLFSRVKSLSEVAVQSNFIITFEK